MGAGRIGRTLFKEQADSSIVRVDKWGVLGLVYNMWDTLRLEKAFQRKACKK